MTKNKRSWYIAASAALLVATVFGASVARGRSETEPTVSVSAAHDLPLPALDRLVARLATEARAPERR
jgi:hypothetical protein